MSGRNNLLMPATRILRRAPRVLFTLLPAVMLPVLEKGDLLAECIEDCEGDM
jgi:hypothetical protein